MSNNTYRIQTLAISQKAYTKILVPNDAMMVGGGGVGIFNTTNDWKS